MATNTTDMTRGKNKINVCQQMSGSIIIGLGNVCSRCNDVLYSKFYDL